MRTLVVIATYNEIENLPRLVKAVLELTLDIDVLVIDDQSPDGTGRWAREYATQDHRLQLIERPGKLGLGTASITGLKYAVTHRYDCVVTMDADFSHDPKYIPQLVTRLSTDEQPAVDVVIGSRYVPGGGVQGWPLRRRWMSRAINRYARSFLRLRVADCSGAFRCYRIAALQHFQLDRIRSSGYSYLEEILWLLQRQGTAFAEIPIVFVDRQKGHSKINWREAIFALWFIFRLGILGAPRS
ncbi:MAG: glycosyl transferase [Planctomycetaceae bacterium]|nr:glycosyl transferase [Planctomycetaceae bacterium]